MNRKPSGRSLPACEDQEEEPEHGSLDKLVQARAGQLVLWEARPIARPVLDKSFIQLPPGQRSVEVILYWLGRCEHWLSPSGWLRAWLRLNLIVTVLLGISALTVVPAGTLVLEGIGGWTAQMGLVTRDVGLAVQRLPPIVVTVGAVVLAVHLIRRHRSLRSRRSYPRHEDFE